MKQFLFIAFCFIVPMLVKAQQRDTMYVTNGKMAFHDASTKKGKAYIEIDGEVFTGKLSSININDIQELSFIKPADAKTLYGNKGVNGAYLIKTKKGMAAAMQPPADLPLDDNKGPYNHSFAQPKTDVNDTVSYVVDGEPSTGEKVKALNPDDIFSVNVLKDASADPSLNHVNKGVVMVITKANVVKAYKQKFSRLSKEYKAYLDAHQNDDSGIAYKYENGSLHAKSHQEIDFLYQFKIEDIKKAVFTETHKKGSATVSPTLLIIAK
ncbi:hypothetical protein AAFN85_11580 [Mucilaginibacter sp. CAU 1740]|uniref:hypothetical protein n=1 Tax=Mucilaginibacter sp. CAU 1740 TaxID=3140365 RepID=UPI00325C09BF